MILYKYMKSFGIDRHNLSTVMHVWRKIYVEFSFDIFYIANEERHIRRVNFKIKYRDFVYISMTKTGMNVVVKWRER